MRDRVRRVAVQTHTLIREVENMDGGAGGRGVSAADAMRSRFGRMRATYMQETDSLVAELRVSRLPSRICIAADMSFFV